MQNRTEQLNFRVTPEEKKDIEKRASERKQKMTDFLRDLLLYGTVPEISRR